MRIGILTQWFTPEPGPASLPGDLARGLAERGHEVEVLTGFPNYPTGTIADGYRLRPRLVQIEPGVRITRVALYPSHDASSVGRAVNYGSFAASAATLGIADAFQRIDALWVNYSPVTIALPMLLQRWIRHTPTVVHVLDLWPDTLAAAGVASNGGIVGRTSVRVAEKLSAKMYRAADRVAFISPGVGDVLAARGVPRAKLAYAPMWADERGDASDGATALGVDLPADHICMTYAGTLGRAQELDTLIRACAQLTHLPLTCLIAGSGTEEQRLQALAEQVGAKNVHFLGRLSRDQIPGLMAMSDVSYVGLNRDPLASITMPSKLQAVLSSGSAVIGTLIGDPARVVEESGAGWIAPPGDVRALVDVLTTASGAGRSALSKRGDRARDYYDRVFSRAHGIDTIERLLVGVAGGQP